MPDPFRRLLARLDGGPAILDDDDRLGLAADWDPLAAAGLIVQTAPATTAACDACDDPHFGEAFRVDVEGLPTRWFLRCPTFGSVAVASDRLRRWTVRVPALGRPFAGQDAEERLPGLVWRLGPVEIGSTVRAGWLVAGWRGARGLADRVPELARPGAVAFVPAHLPTAEVWGTVPPALVSLADVLSVGADGLVLNRRALAAHLPPEPESRVEPLPRLSLPSRTKWEDLTLVVGDHHLDLLLGRATHRARYQDLGLSHRRDGTPTGAWLALVRFAREGSLTSTDGILTKSGTLKNHLTALRNALKRWTGLTDDPFQRTHRLQPYQPRFRIRTPETLGPT